MTITVYFLGFRKSIEDQEAGVTACVLFIWLRVSALELANLGLIHCSRQVGKTKVFSKAFVFPFLWFSIPFPSQIHTKV